MLGYQGVVATCFVLVHFIDGIAAAIPWYHIPKTIKKWGDDGVWGNETHYKYMYGHRWIKTMENGVEGQYPCAWCERSSSEEHWKRRQDQKNGIYTNLIERMHHEQGDMKNYVESFEDVSNSWDAVEASIAIEKAFPHRTSRSPNETLELVGALRGNITIPGYPPVYHQGDPDKPEPPKGTTNPVMDINEDDDPYSRIKLNHIRNFGDEGVTGNATYYTWDVDNLIKVVVEKRPVLLGGKNNSTVQVKPMTPDVKNNVTLKVDPPIESVKTNFTLPVEPPNGAGKQNFTVQMKKPIEGRKMNPILQIQPPIDFGKPNFPLPVKSPVLGGQKSNSALQVQPPIEGRQMNPTLQIQPPIDFWKPKFPSPVKSPISGGQQSNFALPVQPPIEHIPVGRRMGGSNYMGRKIERTRGRKTSRAKGRKTGREKGRNSKRSRGRTLSKWGRTYGKW